VFEEPDVSLSMDTLICINIPPFILTGGLPYGGFYYIDGSLSSIFDPGLLGNGYHDVVYEVANGTCISSDTTHVLVSVCTGLNELFQPSFIELYPNPASDIVNLKIPNKKVWNLELYDALGLCLKKTSLEVKEGIVEVSIDVTALSRGIYWLMIKDDSQRYFKKLVLE
jgi:hypothetical protein